MHARISTAPVPPDRPPLILVHGMVVASTYMLPLAQRLANDFRVYVPDLPGYGDSPPRKEALTVSALADALDEWMDALRLPAAMLIGNSFGCQIIAEFAVRYPGRVDRLVLQGPTVDPEGRGVIEQVRRIIRNSRLEKGAMAEISRRDYRKAGVWRALRTMRAVLADHIEEKLPRVRQPAQVVVGGRDPVVPVLWARRAADLLPRGRLCVVPETTHTMNYVAPDEFAFVTRPFLLATREQLQAGSKAQPG